MKYQYHLYEINKIIVIYNNEKLNLKTYRNVLNQAFDRLKQKKMNLNQVSYKFLSSQLLLETCKRTKVV